MSLLDNASLLLTPNAYKEGKLYSVIPSNGNGDFTVTRATTATRVNAAGLVDLVPYNLFTYSEMFSDASWSKGATTITANTTTAPNGTLTADTLTANGVSARHDVFQVVTLTSGTTYTWSIYAKKGTNDFIQFAANDNNFGATSFANFDLNSGVVGSVGGSFSASIQSVGDGWYRCTTTATYVTGTVALRFLIVTSATSPRSEVNTLTTSVFLWGAQLVEGTSARDYLRTETRLNIPRVDYSLGGCPNILLEPQRTNLALQSSSFDNASWGKANTTATANTAISPSGIMDADTYTANGSSSVKQIFATLLLSASTNYTLSIYAKKDTNNFIQFLSSSNAFGGAFYANFDLQNGVIGQYTGTLSAPNISDVGNGWYRCEVSVVSVASPILGAAMSISLITSATSPRAESNTLTTSVFLWGAQLEAGAYSTSFIPTTTASVTRNADSITRNNIFTNGLITAAGGTWFVELRGNVSKVRDSAGALYFGVNANTCFRIRNISSALSRVTIDKNIAGVPSNLFTTTTDIVKLAIKWDGSTADVFANGVKVVTATAFAFTALEELTSSAGIPLFINEMALLPTPLTDDQLIQLTTL